MNKWQRIRFQPNLPLGSDGQRVTASVAHRQMSKEIAKEGMVLLKNSDKVLPLAVGSKVALFGKATFDYVKGGGGSGDVTVAYTTDIYQGMKKLSDRVSVYEPLAAYYRRHVRDEYESGKVPGMTLEPAVPEQLLLDARAYTDTAIISICRFSGEGWDRKSEDGAEGVYAENWVEEQARQSDALFEKGDFYLSEKEGAMIEAVKKTFSKVILLMNVGGMVDTGWFKEDRQIQSVLMTWQGGMEGGLAAAELICGMGNPSGKLSDTYAMKLADYPSSYNYHESRDYVAYTDDIYVGYRYFETIPGADAKVNYPFGFGLSYTDFNWQVEEAFEVKGNIEVKVHVTNTGSVAGKEVIQLYSMPPQGQLGKAAKNLVAFKKSRLLQPGEGQTLFLKTAVNELASYDDIGKISKSAYVLEKGLYGFFVGTSVRDGEELSYVYKVEEDRVVKQLTEKLSPTDLPKRLCADGTYEEMVLGKTNDYAYSVLGGFNGPEMDGSAPIGREVPSYKHGRTVTDKIMLMDVVEGKASMDTFLEQLSDEEMVHLLGGQPNTGVANTWGFGNLPAYGIPNIMTVDGPAGVRINEECGVMTTAWPCTTLLACTWDEEAVYQVGVAGAKEAKENNLAVWLTPAVNIHRSPLCGRNFEYYSEDPYVTGKLGAAMVKGIQSQGISCAVKHFALNNKETNRKASDSRVSERAAREIYLKAFEIIVEEADPWCIMSAYNMINGHRASENKDLLEGILREEWGFKGAVTTDWWTHGEHYKEVTAGNDIKMACGYPERLLQALALEALSRDDMKKSVKRILELICKVD